ncbi:MAG: hypothetical protein SFT81_05470 [Candidatus Caenarcaniphilales bacterium]|nr:hypothetical protein [Candidatus Caenarcaniphilales bacterium]
MLKDLIATIAGNQADIGIFISLVEPIKPVRQEASRAGFYRFCKWFGLSKDSASYD